MRSTAPSDLDEDQLALALQRDGPTNALVTEIYRRFFPSLVRTAALTLGDSAAFAEDVAQESFASVLMEGRFERLRDPRQLRPFLNAVVRFAALDFVRTRQRRSAHEVANLPLESAEVSPAEFLHSEHPRLEALLERMPSDQRSLLELRFRKAMSLTEISAALGVTYAAAAQRLSRAVATARRLNARSKLSS